MLSERLTTILSFLSQEQFLTVNQLSEKMEVSTKSVRQFIKQLDSILIENGARILTKRKDGFRLQVDDFERFQLLFARDNKELPNNSHERVQYLLDYFLNHENYIKAEELCEILYVCKKTLAIDLKKTEQILKEYELSLERKPYYGLRVVGDEFHIRLCIAKCHERRLGNHSLSDMGNQNELNRISVCVLECLEQTAYHISDIALQNLIVHIHVSIKRVQAEQYVPMQEVDYHEWVGEDEYALAEACAVKLEKEFQISFPRGEIIYMAIHLAGKASGGGLGRSEGNVIISSDLHEIVLEMLGEIFDVFRIDLREDLELIMALGRHLGPLKVRLQFDMKLKNPLLREIRERYSLAYAMAIQACAVLERHFKKLLYPDEIAYIALAIALALERQRTKQEKKTVLLVCASGAGTAKLLAFRMQDMFHDCIKGIITCDEHSVKKQDFSKIDYIFTTVPLSVEVPVPICEVKFLMGIQDIKAMRRMLISGEKTDIMRFYPKDLFFTGVSFDTKEEVIRYLCEKIEERRPLPKNFFEAVMKREQMAQTCMGNQVAMPHPCRVMTEDTFVTICILDKPVMWKEDLPVRVVFLVSVSKQKSKKIQDFYMATARLLLSMECMDELIREKKYETLESLITRISVQLEDS
jgi:lichenan operon transcriptional antiterminator